VPQIAEIGVDPGCPVWVQMTADKVDEVSAGVGGLNVSNGDALPQTGELRADPSVPGFHAFDSTVGPEKFP
jgi:hypothetical protein